MSGSAALDAALALLESAVGGGVSDVVLCPGSRSQALALVAAELERVGAIQLHVRLDERSAGFFALGLAVESGRPVPVITTSGTAVAELAPAMLEAHHAGVPLVALTADRPGELIGTGANQTTVQPGLFGTLIPCLALTAPDDGHALSEAERRANLDAGAAIAQTRGPLHVNWPARAPLSGPVPELHGRDRAAVAGDAIAGAAVASDAAASAATVADAADAAADPAADAAAAAAPASAASYPASGLDPILAAAIEADLSAHPPARRRHETGEFSGAPAEPGAGPEEAPVTLRLDPAAFTAAIVIAGAGAGPEAERVAREGGWPLVAEVSSGARFGPNLVVAAREIYGADSPLPHQRDAIDLVIVFGAPTLSREMDALMRAPGRRLVVVDRPGAPRVQPRPEAIHTDRIEIPPRADAHEAESLRELLAASHGFVEVGASDPVAPDVAAARATDARTRAAFGRAELAVSREAVTREILVDSVWRVSWPHDRLIVAASRLIRDLDARVPGKRIPVHANRGLAGIDGTIATGLGIATASQREGTGAAGTARVLIGDLAFLHDASSLLVGQGGELAPRMQVIVGDDGGGTIFDGLEVAATARPDAFDRVHYTPMRVDIGALARAYGWEYRRAATRGELEAQLTDRTHARVIIHVPLPRDRREGSSRAESAGGHP